MTDIILKSPVPQAMTLKSSRGNAIVLGAAPVHSLTLKSPIGARGPAGAGVPAGGSTGDVLTKTSDGDYATGWQSLGTLGGDKTYSQTFTNATAVTVTHNLGKYPAVTVIDSANDEVEGDIQYVSLNEVVVTFSASFSGVVNCN